MECPICLEVMSDGACEALGCTHRFHSKCLKAWFRHSVSCPCCRTPSEKACQRRSHLLLGTCFSKLMPRLAFPPGVPHQCKILAVLDTSLIMDAWRVSDADIPFLKVLALLSRSEDDFVSIVRRLKL